MTHIAEARQRMLYVVVALLIAFIGCFFVASDIFNFLVEPMRAASEELGYDPKVVYTHPVSYTHLTLPTNREV